MKMARKRYDELTHLRSQFLDTAYECSRLTLPYLISNEWDDHNTHRMLRTPWQSVGAKSVTTLAAKLMLALIPPQTTFFKLQIRDDKLGVELPPEARSELDLSFSKMERMVMDSINGSGDRVMIHQAMKHLIVGGNALLYLGKDGIKHYPLNRYVICRDGNGNVIEIVTKERISRKVLGKSLPEPKPNAVGDDGPKSNGQNDDVEVYTYVRLENGRWVWHQECMDCILPDSRGSAPKNASPWLVLRFNTCDGEAYGRGRVEEYLGDLKSLEALSQALVEGSAAAAKVVFVVSPSSTTKPQTLAQAGNGAIVQGRPDDIGVIQVGKTADFRTAYEMATALGQRISDAFLIMNVRQSERTTAEEVRLTQLELEQQLGGIFSLMTTEFLVPYLNRVLMVLQRSGQLPKIPKDLVRPTIVAGVNALGRGQDRESLTNFITTIAQTMGPEAIMKYIDPSEYIKRLAAAQGIDMLNLVKTEQQMQQEMQQNMGMAQQQELTKQTGQIMSAPMMDPSKNPEAMEMMNGLVGGEEGGTPGGGAEAQAEAPPQ
jgi:hypothetical protein